MSADLEKMKAMLNGANSNAGAKKGNDYHWYRPPSGTEEVKIRVLPHWSDVNTFPARLVIKHYKVPGGRDNQPGSATCMRTFERDCPICNVLNEFEGRLEELNKWGPVASFYFNILVLQDPTQQIKSGVPHLWGARESFFNYFSKMWENPEERIVIDPNQGRDMYIQRETYNGKFGYRPGFSSRPIADTAEGIQSLMSQITDLDKIWTLPDDDDVAKLSERAAQLRNAIEDRILKLGQDLGAPTTTPLQQNFQQPPAQQNQQTVQNPVQNPPPVQNQQTPVQNPPVQNPPVENNPNPQVPTVNRPPNAPECFGIQAQYDADSKKCNDCPLEFHCDEAIRASARG